MLESIDLEDEHGLQYRSVLAVYFDRHRTRCIRRMQVSRIPGDVRQ
jgi:hypothetical protein